MAGRESLYLLFGVSACYYHKGKKLVDKQKLFFSVYFRCAPMCVRMCFNSGMISFSIARVTAGREPGMQNITRLRIVPATARERRLLGQSLHSSDV